MLIDCSCGATNRVSGLSRQRVRCGKCQHVFTIQELLKARQEPPPPKPELSLDDLFGALFGGSPDHDENPD